jgi:TatD DNase family protein
MERLVDTHCHIAMDDFTPDLEEVLERARIAGVERMLVVGSDERGGEEALDLVRRYPGAGLYAAAGIHPHDSAAVNGRIPDATRERARERCVVAVGETGLDYFYDHSPRDVQRDLFALHIALSREIGKPLVVHVRDAYQDALDILRAEKASDVGGVIHCFSGEREHAAAALEMGFFISFAGPLTYPKNSSLRDTAALVPQDMVLCETDSPYLSPQPRRGKRNEPANVRHVYETLAAVRKTPLDVLAEAVRMNAERLFGWSSQK